MRLARKPYKAAAGVTATEQLYTAHQGDGRPNALYDDNGRIAFRNDHGAHLRYRDEWLGYYATAGGTVEDTGGSRGSVVPCRPPNPCELCVDYAAHSIQIAADAHVFVPGVEEIVVTATVTGSLPQVESIHLEVASAAQPNSAIAGATSWYGLAPLATTTDTLRWTGSALGGAYDSQANLNGSPYNLVATLMANDCEYTSNTEVVEVKVFSVTIEIGDVAGTPLTAPVQALATTLATDPAKGRIYIDSPVFRTSTAELSSNKGAVEYQNHAGQGHSVPLLAKILLEARDGTGKRSARATHGTPLLWDFRYDDENEFTAEVTARGLRDGQVKTFVTLVTGHKRTTTTPQGRNCHTDLGGARPSTGLQYRFLELDGAWPESDPAQRDWALYTSCGRLAGTDADGGARFRTGRMAGDTHRITAFVDVGKAYDTAVPATPYNGDAKLKSNTFRVTNWRRVPIVASYKSGTGTTGLDVAALQTEYAKAAVRVELATGVALQEIRATWHTHYQTAVANLRLTDVFLRDALSSNDPHPYPVWYRSYPHYRRLATGQDTISLVIARRLTSIFGGGKLEDYLRECNAKAYDVVFETVRQFNLPGNGNGINMFKFGANGHHNHRETIVDFFLADSIYAAGGAMSLGGVTDRNKGLLMVFEKGAATDTFIHEVGHLLFLAHAPGHFTQPDNPRPPNHANNALPQPADVSYTSHDVNDICLMSYSERKKTLCGFCLLKLAGWNSAKIDQNGTVTP